MVCSDIVQDVKAIAVDDSPQDFPLRCAWEDRRANVYTIDVQIGTVMRWANADTSNAGFLVAVRGGCCAGCYVRADKTFICRCDYRATRISNGDSQERRIEGSFVSRKMPVQSGDGSARKGSFTMNNLKPLRYETIWTEVHGAFLFCLNAGNDVLFLCVHKHCQFIQCVLF